MKDLARLNVPVNAESSNKDYSHNSKANTYDEMYVKVIAALRPLRERMENINNLITSRDFQASGNISKDEIISIENDIHMLGKALCELRIS